MNYFEIFITTLKIAFTGTFICFFISLLIILVVKKYNKLKSLFDFITTLPLALPPVISGYFIVFVSNGNLSFEWIGGSIACAVISLPLVYRMIFITISNIDKKLINTSKILGANKKDTFIFVIFPMIKNGIISALFLGFIRSISEFGATMIVAGNISGKTQTLATAIYTSIQTGNQMSIFILSMLSILIAVISIFIFNYINKKDGLVL
tara:strand:- start:3869 stop:4492 length:624 start_codon:yes stop_codon:yes gene_type:complete